MRPDSPFQLRCDPGIEIAISFAFQNINVVSLFLGYHYEKAIVPKTERQGFEPWDPEGSTVFETVPFGHSGTSP
jgi:hypothetical protein